MAKGPLRRSIENMVSSFGSDEGKETWWEKIKRRVKENTEWEDQFRAKNKDIPVQMYVGLSIAEWKYVLTGDSSDRDRYMPLAQIDRDQDFSKMLANEIAKVFKNRAAREPFEILGTFITDPIVDIFETYAEEGKNDNVDPKEFARAFHGFMVGLTITGGLMDTLLETLSGGQVEGAGRTLNSVYWSLGLGFLGWQTLAPLLSSGLQPGLDRHYKNLYRPARFSASDLRDLYALGKISVDELKREAAYQGWRDKDIPQWIELAYRVLTQGDIFQAFNEGMISQDEAVRRLRVLGYNPDDMPLLFKLNPPKVVDETRDFSASTARAAFRKHLIGEAQLRSVLSDLRYKPEEINVIIQLETLAYQTADKDLSQSQIKQAWSENVLTDSEARHWLDEAGFSGDKIDIILDTWRAEVVPEFRKLNIGTITGAYVEGIINRNQAAQKLQSVGLTSEDATLELDLTEARNPEAFGAVPPPPPRELTPGTLAQLVYVGLITPAQMEQRLVEINFTQADAHLLAEAARIATLPPEQRLNQNTIERAYVAGVITRTEAATALGLINFTPADAETILATVDAEHVEAEPEPPEAKIALLSPARLEDLLIGGLLTAAEMQTRLEDLGFTTDDAKLMVDRAQQLAAPVRRTLTRADVTNAYLVGVLDRTQAKDRLLSLDYTADDAETILLTVEQDNPQVFNPDLSQSTRLPSISALVAATNKGIITEEEYYIKAQEIGFVPNDAQIYLAITAEQERKSTKSLTQSQVVAVYGDGFLSWGEAINRLYQLGYNDTDAILLLRHEKDLIQNTDEWAALLDGTMGFLDVLTALINKKYADQDIVAAFSSLPASTLSALGVNIQDLAAVLGQIPGGQ